mmetsp:Transcript_14042/g.41844  ORF Transcript_14042/g.41844 Transcript_14042/m.41844 type:complete len:268 (-) Transcript_14042:15-818(-)
MLLFQRLITLGCAAAALKATTRRGVLLGPVATPLAAAARKPQPPQFIEREVPFPALERDMVLTQAFGAAAGSARDAADAGDRTGTYAWPGGVALARYLASAPATVKGRRVLELGCGTGAAGIMASWLGAREVLLTDGSPAVLENTRRNVKRNVKSGTRIARLRWGYAEDIAKAAPGSWDLVIAAEVAYQRETLPAFLETVAALLAPEGRALVVMSPELADNGRGLDGVERLMRASKLDILDVAKPRDDDDDEYDYTARYTLARKAPS